VTLTDSATPAGDSSPIGIITFTLLHNGSPTAEHQHRDRHLPAERQLRRRRQQQRSDHHQRQPWRVVSTRPAPALSRSSTTATARQLPGSGPSRFLIRIP
jgi:hypothetical protein